MQAESDAAKVCITYICKTKFYRTYYTQDEECLVSQSFKHTDL